MEILKPEEKGDPGEQKEILDFFQFNVLLGDKFFILIEGVGVLKTDKETF